MFFLLVSYSLSIHPPFVGVVFTAQFYNRIYLIGLLVEFKDLVFGPSLQVRFMAHVYGSSLLVLFMAQVC